MPQSLILECKGEHTYNSEISGVPPGSLFLGQNLNISRLNLIEPRRGFDFLGSLPSSSDRPKKLVFWNSEVFCHYGTTFSFWDGSNFVSRGTLITPTNATSIRAVSSSNKNLYITSSLGLRKTDAIATSIYAAGIPQGLNIALSLAGTGTALTGNKFVTYQYLIGRKDANGNSQFGAVSGRYTIQNTQAATLVLQGVTYTAVTGGTFGNGVSITITAGGTAGSEVVTVSTYAITIQVQAAVSTATQVAAAITSGTSAGALAAQALVTCTATTPATTASAVAATFLAGGVAAQNITVACSLPSGLSTPDSTYFIQLYKTKEAATAAATGEELQLCYESPISTGQATSSPPLITITDIVPDALVLGAYIYTAPSQGGILGNNAIPPLSTDIAEFKGSMFYSDVSTKQSLVFTLVSSGGTGLVVDDTVVIYDGSTTETFTAKASYSAGSKQFIVSTSASLSPSQNIDATVKSFIKCVNEASALVYAFSLSQGALDLPGKMQLQTRTLAGASFTVICALRPAAWQPQLASPATVNNTSANDTFKNGLMWSKLGQPEAVPTKYIAFVGASDDRIKRIIALRDGLFIFKERDGAYVLRGDNESSFSVTPLDITAKLIAPDSLVAVNNKIYGLFEAGICEVSDTGVSIISLPIKDQILPLFGTPLTVLKAYSFGIGAETDGKYILSVPATSSDTTTVKQIVFDVFGRTFCRWNFNLLCGGVNPASTKMYLGGGNTHKVRIERKAFDYTDFADYGNLCTIATASDVTTTTLTIDNTSDMAAGDIIYQSTTYFAYIESVNTVAGTIVIDSVQAWTKNTATVVHMKAIDVKIQWNADLGGAPSSLKQYYEGLLIQQQAFQKSATMYFSSDINASEASIALTSSSGNGAFGEFIWGEEAFGGDQAKTPKRFGIPLGHARCSELSIRFEHKIAYSDFQIAGLSLSFNPSSTRVAR